MPFLQEPKQHANAVAIVDWESKKKKKGRARKRGIVSVEKSSSPAASTPSSPLKPCRQPRTWVVNTFPPQSSAHPQDSLPTRQEAIEVQHSQQPEFPTPPPCLAVQISQHSSFDREQYVHFLASGSAQGLPSSEPQHQDSGLGSSSPLQQAVPEPVVFYREGIVPDSQSLPGSSSYLPTSSRSVDTSAGLVQRTASSGSRGNAFEDVTLSIEVSDPIEDPSSPTERQATCGDRRSGTTSSPPPPEAHKISVGKEQESKECGESSNIAPFKSAVQEEPREELQSSQSAQCAEGLSGIPIVERCFVEATEGPSAALDYVQEHDKGYHHQEDIPTTSLVFQSQVPLTSDNQTSQQRSETESALAGMTYNRQIILLQQLIKHLQGKFGKAVKSFRK